MTPPELIDLGDLELRRWDPAWAAELTVAVRASLPELIPFLPWATEAYDEADSRGFLGRSADLWDRGETFNYAVRTATGAITGGIGLMDRMGPGVLEIGFWMRTAYAGRGHMTAAVQAVTRAGFALPGINRMAIRYDAANAASAAVAAKAGFAEVTRLAREPEAPGETGTDVITERRRAGG